MKFNKTIIFLLVFTIAFTPFKTNAMAASTDIDRKNLPVPTDYNSNLLQAVSYLNSHLKYSQQLDSMY